MKLLKDHPFAVEAHFESSLVLTFALPKERLLSFVPTCLELDTFQEKYAFLAVAMVQTKDLRPKGFPKFFGSDFFLIGYRIFVRFTDASGKRLRGLYILRSETDSKRMEFFGNIFTHYSYSTTDIYKRTNGNFRTIGSQNSGFEVVIEQADGEIRLPENSPFTTWQEARKFAGPLPNTFSCDENAGTVLIIEGVRQNWKPEPVKVKDHGFDFLRELGIDDAVLANAFEITNVPYHWKKGRIEKWP
jgi:hypothetical protein